MDYAAMTVVELRRIAREQELGSGLWIAGASKSALVSALSTGEVSDVAESNKRYDDANTDSLASVIAAAVQSHLNITPELDVEEVKRIAREIVREELPNTVKTIELKATGKPSVNVGVQHEQFPVLLQMIGANIPVYLVGPAGSGKTYAAESAAKALNLPYYCQSVSQQTTVSYLLGYQDANGQYLPSLFRKAYEGGGVYLLDEIDAGNPNVLCILNAAISNGVCAFPDGMILRHTDFRLVSAANTYGNGANRKYVGRNQLDAASLDRFASIDWQYDESLERALAGNDKWTNIVQGLRHAAGELRLNVVISPRASINGARLLAVGMPQAEVLKAVVFKGMDTETVSKLNASLKERGVRNAA